MEEDKSVERVFERKNRRQTVRFKYGLEPALFALYFAFNLTNAVLQNQLLKQTCLSMNYNLTICENLNADNETKDVEEEIQPKVANINMTILIFNSVIPALLSLILGSWSDIYGRRKILMMSFSGYTCTIALITLFSYISDNVETISPWWYLVAELPMSFAGGWPLLDIGVCCYVADLSNEQNRSFRLGTITFLNFMSNVSAYYSSSFILEATNLTTVFIISFSCAVIGFLWAFFMIDETVITPQGVSFNDQVKEIFSSGRIKEIFITFRRPRDNNGRKILWSLMLIVTLVVFTMHGTGTLNYLFVREKFEWTLREWTVFESSNTIISVGGLFIGLTVLKKGFKISDMKLAMLALASSIIDSTFKAFATKSIHMYISSCISLFRLLSTPMFRSIMSIVLPHEEIGKIYSLTTCFEALSGLGAGPLYTTIYKSTFTTFPGAFHLINTSVFAIDLLLAFMVTRWIVRRRNLSRNLE